MVYNHSCITMALKGTVCDTTTQASTSLRTTSLETTTLIETSAGTTPCATFTSGGNANGAMCTFPFTYKSVTYYSCTTIDNNGVLWCATTPNYARDKLWGNCQGRFTEKSNLSFVWFSSSK